MPARDTYILTNGICAEIHPATPTDRRTICELWRGGIHLGNGVTHRNPKDIDNHAIAATTALARALMIFYGRPSLLLHLNNLHFQMPADEYRMLLRQIAEEAKKRKR